MKKGLKKEIYTVIVVEDNSLVYCKTWTAKSSASLDAFGQAVKRNLILDEDGKPLTPVTLNQKYNPWSGNDFYNMEVTTPIHFDGKYNEGESVCMVTIHVDTIEI